MTRSARDLLRRVGVRRRPRRERVPDLARGPGTGAPAVWVLTPDYDRPSGGIKKLYGLCDALSGAGLRAAVVHSRPGFACSWFDHSTTITAARDVTVGPDDLVVVPEVYGSSMCDLPGGIRQVVFNQNVFVTLDALVGDPVGIARPYVDNPDLAAVVAVSEHNAAVLRYLFPDAPVDRVRVGVDTVLHRPSAGPPARRLAYMPRRRSEEVEQVLGLLRHRGVLEGWEVTAIDRMSETEVAGVLRDSQVFLSLSEREGLGLPPLEALAAGCAVVGYDGFAGAEFFRTPFAEAVADGDVFGFAEAAERVLRRAVEDPAEHASVVETGARFVHEEYSVERERDDMVRVFGSLVDR